MFRLFPKFYKKTQVSHDIAMKEKVALASLARLVLGYFKKQIGRSES